MTHFAGTPAGLASPWPPRLAPWGTVFRRSAAGLASPRFPRLAPWATVLRRSAAGGQGPDLCHHTAEATGTYCAAKLYSA